MKKKGLSIVCILLCMVLGSMWLYQHSNQSVQAVMSHQELSTQKKKTIVIDAGHGGYDSGSRSADGILEKDITLSIALKVGGLLEENGYSVIYTRTNDDVSWSNVNVEDLAARVQVGEDNNASYFISIHTNASENYNDGAYGFESYLNYTNRTIEAMASSIEENFVSLSYSQNRGLKSTEENSLYVIDKNSVPALLIEVGFLTDSDDTTYMTSTQGQSQLANAIAEGIISSL